MTFPKWVTGTCVSLLTLIVVTAPLWWLRFTLPGAVNHPVFFYLVPTAILAMTYGVVAGVLFAVAAFASSAFLLYEPMYSFQVSNHALGELFWFLMTALIGVNCIAKMRHPPERPGRSLPLLTNLPADRRPGSST